MARRKNEETGIEEEVPEIEVGNTVTTTQTLGFAKPEVVLTASQTEGKADVEAPSIVPVETEEQMVLINPNFTGRIYIGSRWWDFEKEVKINVPKYVKEVLYRQKGLGAV